VEDRVEDSVEVKAAAVQEAAARRVPAEVETRRAQERMDLRRVPDFKMLR
jgi:hypothetical protein